MNKKIIIFLILSVFLLPNFSLQKVEADSGWDTDYDSSWDSGGFGWDNDYDYDYDDDYNSGYSGSTSSSSSSLTTEERIKVAVVMVIIFISVAVLFPLFCSSIIRKSRKNHIREKARRIDLMEREKRRKEYLSKKTEFKCDKLSLEQATRIIPEFNIEEFNFKAYQIFYDTQIAWMNFDYDKLKDLLTDELYNTYVMDLDSLKLKNQKNTMKTFKLLNSYIFDLKEENGVFIAQVYLDVEFYDYIEDISTGSVLRGSNKIKVNNTYVLTLIKSKEQSNNINECPNCCAPVEGNSSGICEYCKSKLINQNFDWVMSKKEKINQR